MARAAELTTRELLAFGLGALLAMAVFNSGMVSAREVPSGSMAPTLVPGDRLMIVGRDPARPIARGELLVFRPPFRSLPGEPEPAGWFGLGGDTTYVKRVVGLPGERVEIRRGRGVWIDGRALDEPYVLVPPRYDWGPALVPAGKLFVLGDNRNDSFDSHYWGFLPASNVVGRPAALLWPPSRWRTF